MKTGQDTYRKRLLEDKESDLPAKRSKGIKVAVDVQEDSSTGDATKQNITKDGPSEDKNDDTSPTQSGLIRGRFGQFPIGFSTGGKEENAIISRQVYERLPDNPFLAVVNKARSKPGVKLQWETKEQCLTCHPPLLPTIEQAIGKIPLAKSIGTRSFQELCKKTRKKLNLDWTRNPQAPQVAGHLLSGTIMINAKT
ncbi:hypothetical protein BGZ65_006871 [Modicella reniformis]|uniref:Uncharacterized protein n=1 Tax=Modicella reniformis TaxID=1440133 RepID=A0A9P6MGA1_9FUNG|nr:hypothetical protein BGZ65_006871 [Modicella reniformis]